MQWEGDRVEPTFCDILPDLHEVAAISPYVRKCVRLFSEGFSVQCCVAPCVVTCPCCLLCDYLSVIFVTSQKSSGHRSGYSTEDEDEKEVKVS